jgi:hypothetical protein
LQNGWKLPLAMAPYPDVERWVRMSTPLTDEEFDRLKRCANGNTLRFESSAIVAALVAGGYAKEGVARVVKLTPKGYGYLKMHSNRKG